MRSSREVRYFVHPWPLLAVALLIFNDHWLKRHHPSWVSGKLSDFAGLFFFPLFLCALAHFVVNATVTARTLVASIVVTDILFVAIKLSPTAAAFYVEMLAFLGITARVTLDPADLCALVMSPLAYLFARPFVTASKSRSNTCKRRYPSTNK